MKNDLKELFLKSLQANKEYSEAHLQLALIYEEEKDFKNVEKHFGLAISYYEKEIDLIQKRGDFLLKNSQFQNAKIEFSRVQNKRNLCSQVLFHQAQYYLRKNKIEDAEDSFKKSIQMNDLNYRVHRDLAKILLNKGHFDKARYHLEKSVSLNYGDFKSHYYLAVIMLKMKDHDEAEQHFLCSLDILIGSDKSRALALYDKIKMDYPKLFYPDLEEKL